MEKTKFDVFFVIARIVFRIEKRDTILKQDNSTPQRSYIRNSHSDQWLHCNTVKWFDFPFSLCQTRICGRRRSPFFFSSDQFYCNPRFSTSNNYIPFPYQWPAFINIKPIHSYAEDSNHLLISIWTIMCRRNGVIWICERG